MRRLLVAVGAFGLLSGSLRAVEPATAPPAGVPRIAALVEQLGSDNYLDREAASAALEKIGSPALDALQRATRSDIPEVRERAAVLLTKIKRLADSGTRLLAKRVSLDYQDIPLGSAINDLKARTGLNFTLDPNRVANPLRKVTCRATDVPLWEAFDLFCTAAGLREVFVTELDVPKPTGPRRGYVPPPPSPNADGVPIVLIDGKPDRLPGSRSSSVRVLALPTSFAGHKVTLGTGEITLAFDITPIPGLGWQEVIGVKVNKVIDSDGRPGGAGTERHVLPNFDPSGTVVFARPGMAMRFDMNGNTIPPDSLMNPRVVPVPLKLASSARSLKRLEGSVFGEILVPNQHLITVENPQKKLNGAIEGPGELKFSVLEVKAPPGPGGLGTIRVQLEFPSPWAVNARRRGFNPGWPEAPRQNQGNRVEAFDAAGKPFVLATNAFTDVSDDGLTTIQTSTMTFRPGQGMPAKLVVIGPKMVTVEVPFAMENVPLP